MKKNPIEYPCTKCPVKECFLMCSRYKRWFKVEWLIVTEPFRELARQRDKAKRGKRK